jgi:undecaprenyl-diphosphatase
MYKALVTEVFSSKVANKLNLRSYSKDARLGILVLLGSVPAGLAGALFNDFFDATFRSVFSVALFALAGTIFMIAAEVIYKKIYQKLPLEKLTTKKSLFVGICQILPLCPGFSRSGATISAGMLAGLSREDSAKFSFLLSIPVILGAGFLGLLKSHSEVHVIGYGAFAVGFSASFLVGLVAVSFLMKFLKSNNLYPFIVYRLLLVVGLFIILIK